jgi:hypothetical protein
VITITGNDSTTRKIEVPQTSLSALTFIDTLLGMIDRNEPITSNCYYFVQPITIEKLDKKFAKIGLSADGTNQITGKLSHGEMLQMFNIYNPNPRLTFLHDAVKTIKNNL